MKIECFSERRQSEAEGVRMKEGGRTQRARAAIKDIVVVCLRAREDFYGQSFWVCDPLERPWTSAGSLSGELGD